MKKREILHNQWKDIYISKGGKSIFNIYMRSGKTFLSLKILKELKLINAKILISYPDNKILDSWLHAQTTLGIELTNVTYVNTSSIHKHSDESWDIYIFDECTDFSEAQEIEIQKIIDNSKRKDKTVFERFLNKEFNHLAVAKIGGSGVSYPQLDKVILSNFTYDEEDTSQIISRAMMLDYKDKVAKIVIITSEEEVELKKLNRTLQDFDKNKITWLEK